MRESDLKQLPLFLHVRNMHVPCMHNFVTYIVPTYIRMWVVLQIPLGKVSLFDLEASPIMTCL